LGYLDEMPTNEPPVAVDDSYVTDEDVPLHVTGLGVLANDHDPDPSDTLTASLDTSPLHGGLIFYPDGSFDYDPDSDWYGTDSFTYTIFDGTDYSGIATVTIDVLAVNDAPIAYDAAFTLSEDGTLAATLPIGFDADGGVPTYEVVAGTSHGVLMFASNGQFGYTPVADWFGEDTFTYYLFDGEEYSNIATTTMTVESVNDPPIAIDDEFTGNEDTILTGSLLDNDYDVEWDSQEVYSVTGPAHGILEINVDTGLFTYTPDVNWFGPDSFTYHVFDGFEFSNEATVTITILSVNDAPVAYDISFIGYEDVNFAASLPLGFDADGGLPTYEVVTGTSHGVLMFASNGQFGYDPNDDWFGIDTFTYRVFDGTDYSNIATVTIEILPDDDTTGPEITIIYTGGYTDDDPGYWDVFVTDPESGVDSITVEIDGILVGTFEGTYLVSNTLGDHTITVIATNADSNNGPNDQETSTASATITILDDDVTGPEIDITYFGNMIDTDPGFWTVSVDDPESGIYSILVEVDGVTVGTLEGDFAVPSTGGFHSITVTAMNSDMDRLLDQEMTERSAVVFIEATTLPTELVYSGDLEGQYSDPVYLEALLIDTTSGLPIPGKIVHFYLGTQYASAVTDADGVALISLVLGQEAGVYDLIVSFDGDDEYLPASNMNEFVIHKECASVVYSGLTIIEVSDESMTLMATVFDDVDGYWGNLSLAYVTFTVYLSSDPLTPVLTTSPVKVQTTDVTGIGTAAIGIPTLPEGDYLVIVSLLPEYNRFYCSSDFESSITIYEPERAHVHGAGKILDADGHRGFFVFKAKYTCKGNLYGFLLYTYIEGDWVYLVKSCDIMSFDTDDNHGFFEANSTISQYNFKTHERIRSDERYRVRVDVFDNRKNHEKDVFQIRVYDNLGLVEYEAGFDPFGYILKGCIVVRHGHGRRH
ncbi:MAG: Ig-like domain-containing protein, partial [Candidatus Thorarchaeota archaeon]